MQNQYDAIFCDLGNVLIDFDHRIAVKKILEYTPKKEEDIYNLFFDSGITEAYEEGKVSQEEFFGRVKDALDLKMDHAAFFPAWNDIFFETPLNLKMHNFLKRVKSRYKLIMISNLNQSHFRFLKNKMDILSVFDKLVLSYEAGCRKPAPEIYKIALDFAKTLPPRVLYIDDRRDLIEAAGGLGIRGIVFDGERAFERVIKELEI